MNPKNTYKCPTCEETFRVAYSLHHHLMSYHKWQYAQIKAYFKDMREGKK